MPTDEQWTKLVRIVKAMKKDHDQQLTDLWAKVNDDSEIQYVDEIANDLRKEHRRVTRLERRVEALESDEADEDAG